MAIQGEWQFPWLKEELLYFIASPIQPQVLVVKMPREIQSGDTPFGLHRDNSDESLWARLLNQVKIYSLFPKLDCLSVVIFLCYSIIFLHLYFFIYGTRLSVSLIKHFLIGK